MSDSNEARPVRVAYVSIGLEALDLIKKRRRYKGRSLSQSERDEIAEDEKAFRTWVRIRLSEASSSKTAA